MAFTVEKFATDKIEKEGGSHVRKTFFKEAC